MDSNDLLIFKRRKLPSDRERKGINGGAGRPQGLSPLAAIEKKAGSIELTASNKLPIQTPSQAPKREEKFTEKGVKSAAPPSSVIKGYYSGQAASEAESAGYPEEGEEEEARQQAQPEAQAPRPTWHMQKEQILQIGRDEAPIQPPEEEIIPDREKRKKSTKAEKLNIAAAKGRACFTHPWRPAYAACERCKRTFCYADLVSFNNAYYCIEDIDGMHKEAKSTLTPYNIFVYMAAFLLIANSLILAYYIQSQIRYLISEVFKVGAYHFIYNMNYTYALSLVNIILVVLGIASGILVINKPEKGYYASSFVIAFSVLIFTYEYANTNAYYLFIVTGISFVSLVVLAVGKMNYLGSRALKEQIEPKTFDWPTVEAY